MIRVHDPIPDLSLMELVDSPDTGCPVGPAPVRTTEAARGQTVLIFGLPGAFTPTCSAQHLPGYVEQAEAIRAAGVDQIWCVSVNDAFVMHAWGKAVGVNGRVRMLADGSADWAKATGLTLDLSPRGMGLRSARYAMLVRDGVVTELAVEEPGQLAVSGAEAMLARLRGI